MLGEREVLTEFEEILFKDLLDIDFHTRTLSDHFGGAKSDSIEFVLSAQSHVDLLKSEPASRAH